MTKYTVVKKDTLSKIGRTFNISWREIANANFLKFPYIIRVGQVLEIPVDTPNEQRAVKNLGDGDYAIIGGYDKVLFKVCGSLEGNAYNNAISGVFYCLQKNGMSVPISHFGCTSDGILRHYCQTSCHYIQKYPESILVCYVDGTFDIFRDKRIQNVDLKKKVLWYIGGLGLLDNYDPKKEGFCKITYTNTFTGKKTTSDFSDVLRKTSHTAIGVDSNNYVYLLYIKNKTARQINSLCKKLKLVKAVMLDGGHIASFRSDSIQINVGTKQCNIIQMTK